MAWRAVVTDVRLVYVSTVGVSVAVDHTTAHAGLGTTARSRCLFILNSVNSWVNKAVYGFTT